MNNKNDEFMLKVLLEGRDLHNGKFDMSCETTKNI